MVLYVDFKVKGFSLQLTLRVFSTVLAKLSFKVLLPNLLHFIQHVFLVDDIGSLFTSNSCASLELVKSFLSRIFIKNYVFPSFYSNTISLEVTLHP